MGCALAVREVADALYGVDADPDVLEELAEEIATLAAHIHAATHRLLILIARFDRRRGWERAGHRSCAHWLAFRTGYDLGTAREHVRVARALERLPETGRSMARGRLSFSQVRALTRVAEPTNEADLLELAEGCTTAQLERMVRAWKKGSRKEEAEWERERHRSRTLSVFPDEDGMYAVRGRLEPEVGALLMRALEAASDALYRAGREKEAAAAAQGGVGGEAERDSERAVPRDTGQQAASDPAREAARRRADAVGLLAERALAAGFGGTGEAEEPEPGAGTEVEASDGEAEESEIETEEEEEEPDLTEAAGADPRAACGCGRSATSASAVPVSGTRAERYQVVLHVESDTLSADGEPGRSELEDGTRVSAETSRRLSCDAGLVRITHSPDGSILDVGRKTRTIPPALRRALEARDRGCRFPGCGLRFTDAHHLVHWADGGKTSLENTLLLCRYHHRLVHEEGWRIEWWSQGRALFLDPKGQGQLEGGWKPPKLPEDPLPALVSRNRRRGADPDGHTASARWKRERDITDAVFFRATGAV